MNKYILVLLSVIMLSHAATWAPVEKECPICATRSTYYEVMSLGSYVYHYPSKYEYVFWPFTDSKVLYCCRKCWFTCFAWDFDSIPEYAFDDIRTVLKKLAVFETNGAYYVIPMYYRLLIAENIYQLLGRDTEFWCRFYRVQGFHLASEGKDEEAAEARRRALHIAETMLLLEENYGTEKELYYIIGAMKYLVDDAEGALSAFKLARGLAYHKQGLAEESCRNLTNYLSYLIDKYIERITGIDQRGIVFSETPTIAELIVRPEIFVDSLITITGTLVNQGSGYFKDFRPVLKDNDGNVVTVMPWAPVEVPPPINPNVKQPRVMGFYLDKMLQVKGRFRAVEQDNYVLEVLNAEVVSE